MKGGNMALDEFQATKPAKCKQDDDPKPQEHKKKFKDIGVDIGSQAAEIQEASCEESANDDTHGKIQSEHQLNQDSQHQDVGSRSGENERKEPTKHCGLPVV